MERVEIIIFSKSNPDFDRGTIQFPSYKILYPRFVYVFIYAAVVRVVKLEKIP